MKKALLVIVILTLYTPLPALACSCAPDAFSAEGSKTNIETAALIFKGSVQDIQAPPEESTGTPPHQNKNFSKAMLAVQEVYKGQSAKNIDAYFDTVTSCGSQIKQGESGLYILNEYMGVLVSADLCGKYIAPDHMKILKSGGYMKAAQEASKPDGNKTAEQKSASDILPEDIKPVPFTEEFETEEALKAWAKTTTPGGGYTEKRALLREDLTLVFRSYTTGVPTFDVGVYKQIGLKWALVKSHPPVVNDQPMVQIIDDSLVILTAEGGEEILSITRIDVQ